MHLAPKSERSRLWEFQVTIVLFFQTHGDNKVWESYADVVDFWLVAVLPMDVLSFDSTGEVKLDLTGGTAAKQSTG